MKIIKPSYEVIELPEPNDTLGVLQHIEKVGRICYKSEDKITKDSCIQFVNGIRKRRHWAVLEHYIFVFRIPLWIYNEWYYLLKENDCDPDYNHRASFIKVSSNYDGCILSASATALNYMWEYNKYKNDDGSYGFTQICQFMYDQYPQLMNKPNDSIIFREPDCRIRFVDRKALYNMDTKTRLIHDSMSIKFIADRAILNEIVRHRASSFAQESTRYCDYSNGKYGEEITVIEPYEFTKSENKVKYDVWKSICERSESTYMFLKETNVSPEWARNVLPHSLKSELMMTARLYEWNHFFNLRTDREAHPQLRELTIPLLSECIENDKIFVRNEV